MKFILVKTYSSTVGLLRRLAASFLLVLGFVQVGYLSFAQEHSSFKYYDINKIQSNEVIKGIVKDGQGFIWLATDQGVLRFDGTETTLFFKELPSPYAKKFLRRGNGQLLVLTDFGIKEIVHNEDTVYFKAMEINGQPLQYDLNYPKSIYEDRAGNIWVGEVNAVVRISSEGFKRFLLGSEYQSINYHRSFSFTEDAFDNLWIAPYSGRLLKYNKKEDRLEDVQMDYPISDVTCILTYKGDYLIIGGKEGLLKLKIDSDKRILRNEFIDGPENISTAFLVENELYVGTWDKGLFYSHLEAAPYRFSLMESIPFNDILDYYIDNASQEIWITGSENLGLLKPSLIHSVTPPGKFRVESLTMDSLGHLFFSTGSEIYSLDRTSEGEAKLVCDSKATYFDRILLDGDKVWIGEAFGAISYYSISRNTMIQIIDTATNPIKDIYKDYLGNKWFTGRKMGLTKISETGALKNYTEINTSIVVNASPQNELYCGAQGRDALLYKYDMVEDKFFSLPLDFNFKPSSDIRVEDIAFDSLGNPWLATNEGLVKVTAKDGKYQAERVTLKGIDSNEPLKALAIVKGYLWLAYSYALAVHHQDQTVFYTRENGLPSRLLKERCFVLQGDNLFVATAKGMARIGIGKLDFERTSAPIFKSILLNGDKQLYLNKENPVFPYGSRLQTTFVSLTYPGTSILYQTRVVGLEKNWSAASPNSSISVLGFSEGNYTLQVRARGNGYLWSEPLTFEFAIAPPWFKSWWAILLFILLGLALFFISIKIYHFNLIRQKKKMQRIIELRTQELNVQKNEIIEQKNKIIQQKEELIEKNNAVFKSQQALSEADLNYLHLKEKQLQDQIEYRNKQITTHTLNIIQKNEMLRDLRGQLESIIKSTEGAPHSELKKLLKIIDESFRLDKDWEEFKLYFEQIYTGFYAKLKINYPDLTNQELRHCALIRLNLSNSECASILGIAPNSIKVSRTRLRKKLDLENHHSLTDFVMGI